MCQGNVGKDIARVWFDLAAGKERIDASDKFQKFIAIWVSFNALYVSTNTKGDRNQAKKYGRKREVEERHQDLLKSERTYKEAFQYFKKEGVNDDSCSPSRRYEIKKDTCEELLNCIYQVRCNLFHGRKIPSAKRDQDLVENGYTILNLLIKDDLWS